MGANPQWFASTAFAAAAVIVDPNGNVQQAQAAGMTGTFAPSWAVAIGASTSDGSIIWTCVAVFSPAPVSPSAPLPAPAFVNDADGLDPNLILADMIAAFETASGRTLQPAQVERLLINLYAYREALVRNAIQYAAQQNLLAFASFPMLDYLGQLLAITRNPSQPAVTTIQFTLAQALTVPFTIPAGTQVQSSDAQVIFATGAALTIPAASTIGSVSATATTSGTAGNGYLAGQVNAQLSPNVNIVSASNTNTSGGGADPETDDHLRARIQAAPNQFSVAGPSGAYRFFAMSASDAVIDAQVITPSPGAVTVYILTGPITVQPAASPNSAGIANAALISLVQAALAADTVRPLTDTVAVDAVSEVDYQIAGTVTLYADADATTVMAAALNAATQYALNLASRIQRDIVPSQIVAALGEIPGVYEVVLTSPNYQQLNSGQWANCTSINLSQVIGSEHS